MKRLAVFPAAAGCLLLGSRGGVGERDDGWRAVSAMQALRSLATFVVNGAG